MRPGGKPESLVMAYFATVRVQVGATLPVK
jgi:hypothetical protein